MELKDYYERAIKIANILNSKFNGNFAVIIIKNVENYGG